MHRWGEMSTAGQDRQQEIHQWTRQGPYSQRVWSRQLMLERLESLLTVPCRLLDFRIQYTLSQLFKKIFSLKFLFICLTMVRKTLTTV